MRSILGFAFVALALMVTGCASTGAVPRPFPTPGAGAAPAPAAPPSPAAPITPAPPRSLFDRNALVAKALSLRGVPYRNGGIDLSGFDCSGFVKYVFAQFGLLLPRDVREQFDTGSKVKAEGLAPGDLLFFSTTTRGASHVGIAVGGDQFVHAPNSKGVVRVEHLSTAYWAHRFLGARRIAD
jgi:cell wall-associated NlpC family hydrolase